MYLVIQIINTLLIVLLIINQLMLMGEMEGKTQLDEADLVSKTDYIKLAETVKRIETEMNNWKGD